MTNNLKAMHDAFAKHNTSLGPTGSGGIKSEINDSSMMPKKAQTPLQHQSVEKAAKASAAKRTISTGIPPEKTMPGMAPAKFGTKKVY